MGEVSQRLSKQAIPLLMLQHADRETLDGVTRFQKLVFLAEREDMSSNNGVPDEMPDYGYESHNYGPYSKELYDILDLLVEEGIVSRETESTASGSDKQVYELETDIDEFIEEKGLEQLDSHVADVVEKYGDMPLLELLDYVYDSYPEYTTESVLK